MNIEEPSDHEVGKLLKELRTKHPESWRAGEDRLGVVVKIYDPEQQHWFSYRGETFAEAAALALR